MRFPKNVAILIMVGLFADLFCLGQPDVPVSVTTGFRKLPVAELGDTTPWPRFRFQIEGSALKVDPRLSSEDAEGLTETTVVPILPYLVQESYTRTRQTGTLPTVTLESDKLKAIVYPSLGGRLISLYDKTRKRELLFNNPVFQPANLAIRNAWFSGGIEWNGPIFGHSLLTCSPVYVGRVDTSRGPIVRIYEFDRALETTWQVDLFLPPGEAALWVHVKAINLSGRDIRFYWWTNIAVPMARSTRVIVPMDYVLGFSGTLVPMTFPKCQAFDESYPAHYPHAEEFFFRKPGNRFPWSACVDGDGDGISHVSTATLHGRKFFTWGMGRGGCRWMDYLAEAGKGNYLEIQGGVMPTQLHTKPLTADTHIEWTECVAPLHMDAEQAHATNYLQAVASAGQTITRGIPAAMLADRDAFLRSQADSPISVVLASGSGWGGAHERLTGKRISPGLIFDAPLREDERPWQDLVTQGTFSEQVLLRDPRSFAISPRWVAALRHSMETQGATWLHHLHLGISQLENGDYAAARASFDASLHLKRNALAERCLALLDERAGNIEAANSAYMRAWALCEKDAPLAIEICGFLRRHKRHAAGASFLASLPPHIAEHERLQLEQARFALDRGEYTFVRNLLQREFCTIREGEQSLSDMWFGSFLREESARLGRELTPVEKQAVQDKNPPPRSIDFRMK